MDEILYPGEDFFFLLVCLGKSQAIFEGAVCLKIRNSEEKSDLTVWRGEGEMWALISVIIALSALQKVGYSGIDINSLVVQPQLYF